MLKCLPSRYKTSPSSKGGEEGKKKAGKYITHLTDTIANNCDEIITIIQAKKKGIQSILALRGWEGQGKMKIV